jgi:hypothetical protein
MPAIQEALDRMDSLLLAWDGRRDYRSVFARSYRTITARMKEAVERREFEDNDWMEALDVQFAQEYFDAVEAYETGQGSLPACWRLSFDLAVRKRTTVAQDLLLGMNAHIVHDLAIALSKVGLGPAEREARRRDHDRVNEVLAGMIDAVQEDLGRRYSLILRYLDRFTGHDDELLTDRGIRAARSDAWRFAIELADAPSEAAAARVRARIDERASALAHLLGASSSALSGPVLLVRRLDGALASLLCR